MGRKGLALAAFMVLMLWYVWYWIREKSRGLSQGLLLFVIFALLGFWGLLAAESEMNRQYQLELGEKRCMVSGVIEKTEEKKGRQILVLRKVTADRVYALSGLLVYLEGKEGTWYPGMKVAVTGEMKELSPARNPGTFDSRKFYRSQRISWRMYGDRVEILDSHVSPYRKLLQDMRTRGLELLEQITASEDTGIFQAVILGEKGNLEEETKLLYQRNGIAHLLAISGLHMSLLGMGFYQVLRKLGAGYGIALAVGGVWVVSYGILTGGSASVLRAVIMLLCAFWADYEGRTYDLLSASCLAFLLLMADSPYSLLDGGVQLSFGAVWAIGGISPVLIRIYGSKHQSFLVSLAIQLTTAPMILYHFFQYPLYGIFLNFLVIPLMTYVVLSGLAGILIGSFWLPGGVAAVGSGHYILSLYTWLCQGVEKLPAFNLILGQPEIWQLAVYYGILAAVCLIQYERKKPWVFAIAMAAAVWLVLPLPPEGLEVTFVDVGQGDGILLETAHTVILIDGGSSDEKELGKYTLEPLLKSKGISRIDYVMVSHGDGDHISGLIYLLEESEISIQCMVISCQGTEEESLKTLKSLVENRGGSCRQMKAGDVIVEGSLRLTCLFPGREDIHSDINEHSLVLRADYGDSSFLFTGDLGTWGEERMMAETDISWLQDIDMLKVGHHGSDSSSSEGFLDRVRPQAAVLSYGKDNAYGHPHEEVVKRLNDRGIMLLQTAELGAITVETDGKGIRWKSFLRIPLH